MIENEVIVDFFSGFTAGFIAVTCCAPLELIRTRLSLMNRQDLKQNHYGGFFKTCRTIYGNEGLSGFYKGYKVTAAATPIFHSLFFAIYNYAKIFNRKLLPNQSENYLLINSLSSSIAGLLCNCITNPLWVVRTRVQAEFLHSNESIVKYSITGEMRKIVKNEGYLALYKGLSACMLGLIHPIVYFPLYENLKWRTKKKKGKVGSIDIFVISCVSKLIATMTTYPHVLLRSRMQDNRENLQNNHKNHKLLRLLRKIHRESGIKGFYSGLKIDLIRVLPANAITFIVYEYVKKLLLKKKPKPL